MASVITLFRRREGVASSLIPVGGCLACQECPLLASAQNGDARLDIFQTTLTISTPSYPSHSKHMPDMPARSYDIRRPDNADIHVMTCKGGGCPSEPRCYPRPYLFCPLRRPPPVAWMVCGLLLLLCAYRMALYPGQEFMGTTKNPDQHPNGTCDKPQTFNNMLTAAWDGLRQNAIDAIKTGGHPGQEWEDTRNKVLAMMDLMISCDREYSLGMSRAENRYHACLEPNRSATESVLQRLHREEQRAEGPGGNSAPHATVSTELPQETAVDEQPRRWTPLLEDGTSDPPYMWESQESYASGAPFTYPMGAPRPRATTFPSLLSAIWKWIWGNASDKEEGRKEPRRLPTWAPRATVAPTPSPSVARGTPSPSST